MMEEWEKEQESETARGEPKKDLEDWEGGKMGMYLSCREQTHTDGSGGEALNLMS